ncbi:MULTISPECIES: outer membrane usher protein [Enterobacter]|uniref:outer membrane usher protein n=1 Tax=Enterobacter TaxID=547 RepID=UPI00048975EE|nr:MULTISPECIES: outer membrane usher protein [Enterobacter cloacae complex]MCD2460868.1 outer membrane usher protein [Enterobacter cloacae complex sp. 2021EL-01261]MDT9875057.1 outer membrane usher protein [Enterobacter cloacae]HDT2075200.1 outer membrane usher protein [Enterobacter roggenkampii]HEG2000593.1 outer membrane usher protein [Enterobacter asburiae]
MFFRRSFLCLSISAAIPLNAIADDIKSTVNTAADDVEFNDQFLFNTGNKIDVGRFSQGNPILPGKYQTKINVNGKAKITTEVEFKDNGTPRATPCMTLTTLRQVGINTESLEKTDSSDAATCFDITKAFPGATVNFNSSTQELDLTVPQLYVLKLPQGYVDPSLWEEGIPVAMASYDLNAWHSEGTGSNSDSAYAGLRYGANLGPWRFRSRGSLNWNEKNGSDYSNQDIYLQRDITPLKAQMLIGDSYTRGDAFDSIGLRGLRLYNDDRMLPNGLSSYAPVIRGVANSNARVSVTQSGNKIYETTVPPGAFEISDLSTTGYGNDLLVTIEEADGSKRSFSVPYSSVTQMLRPGFARWDVGAGELHDDSLHDSPKVAYATLYYGLNNTFTGYTGLQYMDTGFYAGLAGLAMNTEIGAFALDVTHSSADIDGLRTLTGQSYRLSFSKMLSATDTSLNVAAYRFSTEDYLSLHDAASLADRVKYRDQELKPGSNSEDVYSTFQRMKNQIQVNISQPLRTGKVDYGSMYVNGSWQDYWDGSRSSSNYTVGYSNAFTYGSYSVSLQRTYDEFGEQEDSVYLNVSLPFDALFGTGKHPAGFNSVNVGLNSDFNGSTSLNTTANGNTEDNRFNYSVTTSNNRTDDNTLNQISGYGSYNSPYGPLSLSASASDDNQQQYSASYSGGMLLHSGGITLAPGSISDTDSLALIKASGAKGARLNNGDGEIGNSGYAIMPYLSAYRENRIGLDTSTMSADVEVKNTSTVAVPRSGAVVLVNFETNEGRSAVLELQRSDKGFIPLGADVLNEKGEIVGSVGQAGQAYVRGIEDKGTLRVVWGNGQQSACNVQYQIQPNAQKAGLTTLLTHQLCRM